MSNRDWFSIAAMVLMAPHIDKAAAVVMGAVFVLVSLFCKDAK